MNNEETVLDVQGMTCPSCIRHVNAALADLDGVAKVEVSLRDGKVIVLHDPEAASVTSLIQALADVGYDAKEKAS
jgi:copper chaperone